MARILLPAVVTSTGLLLAAGFAMTKYTSPIEGASSDPALYNLIAGALHDPGLTSGPHPGQSSLPVTLVPAVVDSSTAASLPEKQIDTASVAATSAASAWAAAAAKAGPEALRDWLGRWVVATSVVTGDTVRMTLRRISRRAGCPWVSTLVAKTARVPSGDYHLVEVSATCPSLELRLTGNPE